MTLLVNGRAVSAQEIEKEIDLIKSQYEEYARNKHEKFDRQQLLEWCRENVIERTLIWQEAGKAGIKISNIEVLEIYEKTSAGGELKNVNKKDALNDIEMMLRAEKWIAMIRKEAPEPTDMEIREYYDKRGSEDFRQEEQVHAAHIVKHVSSATSEDMAYGEICKIQNKLKNGVSFEELANTRSDCTERGGDIGYFGREAMEEPFELAAFRLKPGQLSDIVKTSHGYHIIKSYEKIPAHIKPFDLVRECIANILKQKKEEEHLASVVDRLRAEACVEVIE